MRCNGTCLHTLRQTLKLSLLFALQTLRPLPPFPLHTPTPTQSIPNPFISSSLCHLSICAVHTNLLIHLLHTSAHLLHTSAHLLHTSAHLFPSDPHSKLVFSTHIHQSHTHTPPPPLPHTHTHIPTLHTSQLPTLPQRLVVLHIVFLFSLFLCYLLLQHNSRLLPQTTLKKGFRWYIIHLNYCGCVTVCS